MRKQQPLIHSVVLSQLKGHARRRTSRAPYWPGKELCARIAPSTLCQARNLKDGSEGRIAPLWRKTSFSRIWDLPLIFP